MSPVSRLSTVQVKAEGAEKRGNHIYRSGLTFRSQRTEELVMSNEKKKLCISFFIDEDFLYVLFIAL